MVLGRLPLIVNGRGRNSMPVNVEAGAHQFLLYSHSSAADFVVVFADIAAAVEGEGHEDPLVEVLDMAAGLVLLLGANNWVGVVRKPVQSFVVAVSGFVGIHSTYYFRSLPMADTALLVVSGAAGEDLLLTWQILKNS